MDLSFLSSVKVEDTSTKAPRAKTVRNPEGLRIRLYADGSCYPSLELVKEFNLEFKAKPADPKNPGDQGNGFDVIDTDMYKTFNTPKRLIIVSPTDRNKPKIDLFQSTTYEENGEPKSSVIDQGATTYGKKVLIPMLSEVYGVVVDKDTKYVDLLLVVNPTTGKPFTLQSGRSVTAFPKKMQKGDAAGEWTTVRREEPVFYVLIPDTPVVKDKEDTEDAGTELLDKEAENSAKLFVDTDVKA